MFLIRAGRRRRLGLRVVGDQEVMDEKLRQERAEVRANSKAALRREIELHKRLVSFT